jgi:hypothetical protein
MKFTNQAKGLLVIGAIAALTGCTRNDQMSDTNDQPTGSVSGAAPAPNANTGLSTVDANNMGSTSDTNAGTTSGTTTGSDVGTSAGAAPAASSGSNNGASSSYGSGSSDSTSGTTSGTTTNMASPTPSSSSRH